MLVPFLFLYSPGPRFRGAGLMSGLSSTRVNFFPPVSSEPGKSRVTVAKGQAPENFSHGASGPDRVHSRRSRLVRRSGERKSRRESRVRQLITILESPFGSPHGIPEAASRIFLRAFHSVYRDENEKERRKSSRRGLPLRDLVPEDEEKESERG